MQAAAGRDFHGQRFGPRPLDLDIIAFGTNLADRVSDEVLQIPHPRWRDRDFVIAPVADLYGSNESIKSQVVREAHELWTQLGGRLQTNSGRFY